MNTTELKETLKTGAQNESTQTTVQTEDINQINSELEKSQKREQEALQKVADMEFNASFDTTASIYPHAKDFRDQIKEKTKLGLTAEEAAIIVLKKENKLLTQDEVTAQSNRGEGLGGSSLNVRQTEMDPNKPKSLEQLETDFKEAEARGEIKIGN